MRTWALSVLALLALVDGGARAAGEEDALKALGASSDEIQRDEKAPGKPVVGLTLEGVHLKDDMLVHLKDLPHLRELKLVETKVGDKGMEHLKGLTKLRVLVLRNTAVTDAGVAHLKGLTELRGLGLLGSPVSDAGLAHLKGLRDLQLLSLAGTSVTDAGLAHLKGLAKLRHLDLSYCAVSGAGLAHLKGLTSLRYLDLNETDVGDTGIANVRGLANLEKLSLWKTDVTDAGLANLKGLRKLKDLDMSWTDVTAKGVAELKKALPKASIISRGLAPDGPPSAGGKLPAEAGPDEGGLEHRQHPCGCDGPGNAAPVSGRESSARLLPYRMETTYTETLERQELIQKLIDRGHGPLVDAMLSNEPKVYTRSGRLNKSAACRALGWRPVQLERALAECRDILAPEFGDD